MFHGSPPEKVAQRPWVVSATGNNFRGCPLAECTSLRVASGGARQKLAAPEARPFEPWLPHRQFQNGTPPRSHCGTKNYIDIRYIFRYHVLLARRFILTATAPHAYFPPLF